MHFDYAQEQRMLAESVRRMLESLPRDKNLLMAGTAASALPRLPEFAKAIGDLGLLGVMASEQQGGLGLGLVDASAAAIETGRDATPFPVIDGIAAVAYLAAADPAAAADVIAGRTIATAAIGGKLRARQTRHDVALEGTLLVPFAKHARWLVAPIEGWANDEHVAVIDLTGLRAEDKETIDITYQVASVTVSQNVSPAMLLPARLQRTLGVLACAEMVGAADVCLSRTVDYMKTRKQFGQTIGSFQALKHMAADAYVGIEAMRAAAEYAAWAHDDAARRGDADAGAEADAACHIAKSFCSDTAKKVAEVSIQLHGGIAFTWEYGIHLQLRRILRLAGSFGNAYDHRESLAAMVFGRLADGAPASLQ